MQGVKYKGTWQLQEEKREVERAQRKRREKVRAKVAYSQAYSRAKSSAVGRVVCQEKILEARLRRNILQILLTPTQKSVRSRPSTAAIPSRQKTTTQKISVDRDRLTLAFQSLGYPLTLTQVDSMFTTVEKNNNGTQTLTFEDIKKLRIPPAILDRLQQRAEKYRHTIVKQGPQYAIRSHLIAEEHICDCNDDINTAMSNITMPMEIGRVSEDIKQPACSFSVATKFNSVSLGDTSASGKQMEAIERRKQVRQLQARIISQTRDKFKRQFFVHGTTAILMEIFIKHDVDKSGSLDKFELDRVLKSINIHLTDEELDALILTIDKDGSGEVEYSEFVRAMAKQEKQKHEKPKMHKFGMNLIFGDRTYAQETKRLKKEQRDQCRELFRPIDLENAVIALRLAIKTRGLSAAALIDFFLKHDKDGGGDLDVAEFKTAMNDDLKIDLSSQHLDALVSYLDQNNDGQISYNELSVMLKPLVKRRAKMPHPSDEITDSAPHLRQRTWYGPKFHSIIELKQSGDSRRTFASLPQLSSKRPPHKRRHPHAKSKPTIHSKSVKTLPASNFFSGFLGSKSLSQKSAQSLKAKTVRLRRDAAKRRQHISSAPVIGLEKISDDFRDAVLAQSRPNTSMG